MQKLFLSNSNSDVSNSRIATGFKEEMKDFLTDCIHYDTLSYPEICDQFTRMCGNPLDTVSCNYVTKKYKQILLRLFEQEALKLLENAFTIKNHQFMRDCIIIMQNNCKTLSGFSTVFGDLRYFARLEKNMTLFSKKEIEIFCRQLNEALLTNVLGSHEVIEKEFSFVKALTNFLTSCKNMEAVVKVLNIKKFCDDKFTILEILKNINKLGCRLRILSTASITKHYSLFVTIGQS